MKFEDPKKYLNRPDEFTDYTMGLYFEYRDLVYDMYNKIAPLFPEIPPQIIEISTVGGIDEYQGRSINGMNVPPNRIYIYLYSLAITTFEDCVNLHRNDVDTVFKANLAFVLLHEMSHVIQFTYVPAHMRNAMEYANDRHVYEHMIPIAAPMLKKQYKINILKDRVDDSVTKVYSYKYIAMNTEWERLINLLVYTALPKSSYDITPREKSLCEAMTKRIFNDIVNLRVIFNIDTIYTKIGFDKLLKQNGVPCMDAVMELTNMIETNMPISFDIYIEFDLDNLNDSYMKITIGRSTNYKPIDDDAYRDLLS